jgi:hypothetical protein
LKCLLILGYRSISIGLRRSENASHVVQVAGSHAETHHGHLMKSRLVSPLARSVARLIYFGLVSLRKFSASLRRLSTGQRRVAGFSSALPMQFP